MSRFDVGQEAGAIFYLLEQQNYLSLKDIEKMTLVQERKVLLALGWLARDNRIVFCNDNGELYVRLNKPPMTEIHY